MITSLYGMSLQSPYRRTGMYNPIRTRSRRSVDPDKTMCELYIQADHLYYEKWGSNVDTVIEQLTAHVEAVNDIYKITGRYPAIIFSLQIGHFYNIPATQF